MGRVVRVAYCAGASVARQITDLDGTAQSVGSGRISLIGIGHAGLRCAVGGTGIGDTSITRAPVTRAAVGSPAVLIAGCRPLARRKKGTALGQARFGVEVSFHAATRCRRNRDRSWRRRLRAQCLVAGVNPLAWM